jgi:hypothetical protein
MRFLKLLSALNLNGVILRRGRALADVCAVDGSAVRI